MAEMIDIARLILQAEDVGFADVRDKIARLQKDLDHLQTMYRAGAVDIDMYTEKGRALQGELDDLAAALKKAEDSLKKHGTTQAALTDLTKKAQSGMAGLGQSFLQTGRVVQDFQAAGLRGVLNNVEGLVQALGGPAGLAGALTVVAVAFEVLKPQIQGFFDAFMQEIDPERLTRYTDQLGALKERIEELAKQHTIGIDTKELEAARDKVAEIEAGLKAFESLSQARGKPEEESGAAVKEAFEKAPGGAEAVLAKLRAQMVRQSLEESVTIRGAQQRMAQIQRDLGSGQATGEQELLLRGELDRLAQTITQTQTDISKKKGLAEQTVGDILERAQTGAGPVQEQAQRQLRTLLERTGQQALAGRVREAAPENMRARALEEQGAQIQEGALRELEQARKEQQEEAAARIEEQLHNRDVTEKQLATSVKEARDKANRALERSTQAEQRRQEELARDLGGGGLQLQAEQGLLQLRAQGGQVFDRFGRPRQLTPEQQTTFVQGRVGAEVQRIQPELSPLQVSGVAQRITGGAERDLTKRLAGIGARTQTDQERLTAVGFELAAELDALGARQFNNSMQIERLERRVMEARSRQRTAARRPGSG